MVRSFFSILYGTTQKTFESDFDVYESSKMLAAASVVDWSDDNCTDAMVGTVSACEVFLSRATPKFRNSFKPYFRGEFQAKTEGTKLVGYFSMHPAVKIFCTAWFSLLSLWTVKASVHVLESQTKDWHFPAFGVILFLSGIFLINQATKRFNGDAEWLSRSIQAALERSESPNHSVERDGLQAALANPLRRFTAPAAPHVKR